MATDSLVCHSFSRSSIATNEQSIHSGSAVCRAALRHGFQVTSIRCENRVSNHVGQTKLCYSSSGRPYQTPKGHTPTWTEKVVSRESPFPSSQWTDPIEVEWLRADALRPKTYSHLLPDASAVVHTLGTLLADTKYKDALRQQDLAGAAANFLQHLTGAGRNPLEESPDGYERLNRDSGL